MVSGINMNNTEDDNILNYKEIRIIYEDNHLLVCIKPEGVLSQKDETNGPDMLSLLKAYLKEKYAKVGDAYLGLIHRLDRRVSGVMVFCKTSKAASRLSEDIRKGNFKKKYICICSGYLDGEGILINNLKKENNKSIMDDDGKECKLGYKVINHFTLDKNDFSVVLIDLYSGRFNQIRKQMSLINHPLINDYKYGYKLDNYGDSLGLRCIEISLIHPTTKEQLTFKAGSIGSLRIELDKKNPNEYIINRKLNIDGSLSWMKYMEN